MHPAKARRLAFAICAALPFVFVTSQVGLKATGATTAPPTTGTAKAIEWDLPAQMDSLPGAIFVDMVGDGNRVWFVSRSDAPHVYRVDLPSAKKLQSAPFFAWSLDPAGALASGLRRIRTSRDRRFVFVRTTFAMQRVDTGACVSKTVAPPTASCTLTVWDNQATTPADPAGANTDFRTGSDIAVDDYNNVYSAVGVFPAAGMTATDPVPDLQKSFIERLNPGAKTYNITRWYVGGGAGVCPSAGLSFPCLSGVAINPRSRNLIYYSEPTGGPDGAGAISELDPATNAVRRWTFAKLNAGSPDPAMEPRQVQFDSDGTLWTVTGSGHLVSLDPKRNRMTKHTMPARLNGFSSDPFGVAPDGGFIGYTDSDETQNKVAMLVPARNFVLVGPDKDTVVSRTFSNPGMDEESIRTSGAAAPMMRTFVTTRTTTNDGTFVEANTMSGNGDSLSPSGITPDTSSSVGTFFYAVGIAPGVTDRFGRIRLPRQKERARVERDDDDFDDDGKRTDVDDDVDDDGVKNGVDADNDNDAIPDVMDDDQDNDGIEDSFDTPDHKESRQTSSQDVAAADYALDQFTLNPNTLVAVLSATSTNALAPVSVEVLNEAGQVVAASLPSPGAAVLTWTPPAAGGVFTIRVKNQGTVPATISTKMLSRELWPF